MKSTRGVIDVPGLLLACLLGLGATPARGVAQRWTPELRHQRLARLAGFWAQQYDVPDSIYLPMLDSLPPRLEWASCSRSATGLRISCGDAYADSTPAGCRAAAIVALAERVLVVRLASTRPQRIAAEVSCPGRRVELAVSMSGASELRETEPGTRAILQQARSDAPTHGELSAGPTIADAVALLAASAPAAKADSTSQHPMRPPDLINREDVSRRMERDYPPTLKSAGIGGTASIWLFVDERGHVVTTSVRRSSGHPELDAAALSVAWMMQFRPARRDDKAIAVWVALPVVFETR